MSSTLPAGCYWYEGKRNGRILSGNDETGPEMTKNNTAWLINGLNLTQLGPAKYVSTGWNRRRPNPTDDPATKYSMTDGGETWQSYKVDKHDEGGLQTCKQKHMWTRQGHLREYTCT